MSKQLKYKLKKTLKNAEFVHADLEYHKELSQDALRGFQEEIGRLINELSDEDKKRLEDHLNPPPVAQPAADESEPEGSELVGEEADTDLIPTDIPPEKDLPKPPKLNKEIELKKLFRRIAEHTHPDKVRASGFSEKEILRLERVFIRAKQAYDSENWYILYSIALDLDLSIDGPSTEQVEWIEDDIKKTLAKISAIANLTAWHWYVGDDDSKKLALKFYFQQIYGFEHPSL